MRECPAEAKAPKKTRVTLEMTAPTKAERDAMAKFGAIEGGNQTLGRLESYLTKA